MRRILKASALLSIVAFFLVLGGAYVLSERFSTEVTLITPKAPEAVALEKMLWEPGASVAAIYGVPTGETRSVLLADPERIIRPPEDPSLVLYTVDKEAGDNPLQEKTLWFATRWLAVALGAFGLLALAALRFFPPPISQEPF
jgi:hypothetical protein